VQAPPKICTLSVDPLPHGRILGSNMRLPCFYHPEYYLPLPEGHPFPMEKFPDAHALLRDSVEVKTPASLAREDLLRAHQATYLEAVSFDAIESQPGLSSYDRNRLGLPAHPRLLARSMLETAGTVSATLAALEHGCAANLAGGTHHAFPHRGLGFCVLNDVAVAVTYLQARGKLPAQILIVDTDAHQGNANHAFFRSWPSVFTYSIHVGKNYPAAKEPGDLDVPLPREVSGAHYLSALEKTMPKAFQRTEPDLVFWISGADPHCRDRFGQMRLSDGDLARRDQLVLELTRHYEAQLVVLYGGGYQPERGRTGALHAATILRVAEACGQGLNPPSRCP
jgi:acetoin utilization deacetylase AcuC-like enzyme